MLNQFIVLGVAALLAYVISRISRWLALCTTAAGGLTVAYFLMPPDNSLRVDNPGDWITLLAYGAGGILLTRAGAKRRERGAPDEERHTAAPPRRRTSATEALHEALVDWDSRLRSSGIQFYRGALPLPRVSEPHDDTVRVFSDLFRAAVDTRGARHVWVHGAELPGRQVFFWCIETGAPQGDGAGEGVLFQNWPASVRATASSKRFERVYEVTFSGR